MPDYRKMYFRLYNRVTEAILLLQIAQSEGERAFSVGSVPEILEFRPSEQRDDTLK